MLRPFPARGIMVVVIGFCDTSTRLRDRDPWLTSGVGKRGTDDGVQMVSPLR